MRSLLTYLSILFVVRTSLTKSPQLSLQWVNEICIGGERGLLSTGLWLSLNAYNHTDECSSARVWIEYNSSLPDIDSFFVSCSTISNATFEFEQPEHGGGLCHCVQIDFVNRTTFNLCGKTANETRKVQILWTPDQVTQINGDDIITNKTYPFDSNCTGTPRLSIVFTMYSNFDECSGSLNSNDDVEVYIRFLSEPTEWIPLAVIQIYHQIVSFTRHGYDIPYILLLDRPDFHGDITICNFSLTDSIQVRWLVTSRTCCEDKAPTDVWSLDDVEITLITERDNYTLLADSFDMNELNREYWTPSNIRNGKISTSCSVGNNNRALTFGEDVINKTFAGFIVTQAALTNVFSLKNISNNGIIISSLTSSTLVKTLSPTASSENFGYEIFLSSFIQNIVILETLLRVLDSTMSFMSTVDSVKSIVILTPTNVPSSIIETIENNVKSQVFMSTVDIVKSTLIPAPTNIPSSIIETIENNVRSQVFISTVDSVKSTLILTPSNVQSSIIETIENNVKSQVFISTVDSVKSTLILTPTNIPSSIIETIENNVRSQVFMSTVDSVKSTLILTPSNVPSSIIETIENSVKSQIFSNQVLSNIFNLTNNSERLSQLQTVSSEFMEDPANIVYILADTLNNKDSPLSCDQETIYSTGVILNNVVLLSNFENFSTSGELEASAIGTTLLQSVESLTVTCQNQSISSSQQNIAFEVLTVDNSVESLSINTSAFNGWSSPFVSVKLPLGSLRMLFNDTISVLVNVVRNLSNILPTNLAKYSLISDVVGISVLCNNANCRTSNINLDQPVKIDFQHSPSLVKRIRNESINLLCVFLDIRMQASILSDSEWSTRGCSRNEALSSDVSTVCECTHLTHFAILLSAKPVIPQDPHVSISLSVIGYVGVTVSVVALVMTVITFTVIEALRNLRGFIHVNLCINLAIAQIIFVAGVDKTSENSVPIHCRVIAVLLHYFFLVSFMWMLMEGVFLYFALVKVFITNTKKYMLFFSTVSYGLPLLYMGLITLPLGFALKTKHYGYDKACFLNTETHFIWAFIGPVILIFLTNICFLIMAAVIMWRQQKKRNIQQKSSDVGGWLKAVITLMVVMGISWIIGLAVVEREELLPLAYIFTFIAAFQGVTIYVVLVVLTKSVRDELIKWAVKKSEPNSLTVRSSVVSNATPCTDDEKISTMKI